MIPSGIAKEDFIYRNLPDEESKRFYDEFQDLLDDFSMTIRQKGEIEANFPVIYRICIRVDQRKDYYMYYHSKPQKIMEMSHEKELALWSYWVCKYKAIHFLKGEDEERFFVENGCMLSDAFAAYILISAVCAKNENRASYFTPDVVRNLYYDFANRDFSKEALIARVNDLIH